MCRYFHIFKAHCHGQVSATLDFLRHMMRSSLFFCAALLLVGCAHTKVSSYKAQAADDATCTTTMVLGKIGRIEHQTMLEDAFIAKLEERKIRAIRGIDVIPPTESQSPENVVNAFARSSADCMILISLREGTISEQEYKVAVLEKISGKNIWVGDTSTKSYVNAVVDKFTLMTTFNSLASSVVSQLVDDGIFR